MKFLIQVFESIATVADHRTRERFHCLSRDLDRSRGEKLVVWDHRRKPSNAQGSRSNAQCGKADVIVLLFLDETDVAAAFDAGDFYV